MGSWRKARQKFFTLIGAYGMLSSILISASWAGGKPPSWSLVGAVKSPQQLVVSFSQDQVALGDPRAQNAQGESHDPVELQCKGWNVPEWTTRWLDSRRWVLEFVRPLPGGIRCSARMKGTATVVNEFHTGGPAIKQVLPSTYTPIVEDQHFVLQLDAPADVQSALAFMNFYPDFPADKMSAEKVDGSSRQQILESLPEWELRQLADPLERDLSFSDLKKRVGQNTRIWVVRAKRPFASGAKVRFVWGAGIKAEGSGLPSAAAQDFTFQVVPAPLAQWSCERESERSACLPLGSMSLSFNTEVAWALAKNVRVKTPEGAILKPEVPEGARDSDVAENLWVSSVRFNGPFAENAEYRVELGAPLEDSGGRKFSNLSAFPLTFKTGKFPPLVKFPSSFGILETDSPLPVTVRQVETRLQGKIKSFGSKDVHGKWLKLGSSDLDIFERWLRDLNSHAWGDSRKRSLFTEKEQVLAKTIELNRTLTESQERDGNMEVMGLPLPGPGLYVVELESPALGKSLLNGPTMYVPTAVLVTSMAVHFKAGRESSEAWVTSLKTGEPIQGAEVTLRDCKREVIHTEKTGADGRARFPGLNDRDYCSRGLPGYLVVATQGDDLSFVSTEWDEGIEPWRYGFYQSSENSLRHTVLDRGLYRAGEKLFAKTFLRTPSGRGFEFPRKPPEWMTVCHVGSGERFSLPLEWKADGTSTWEWSIPKTAVLGTYALYLTPTPVGETSGDGSDAGAYCSGDWAGSFDVEAFQLPALRARVQLSPKSELDRVEGKWIGTDELKVDVSAQYLSGGAASYLKVKTRALIRYGRDAWVNSNLSDWPNYEFLSSPLKEGDESRERNSDSVPVEQQQKLGKDGTGTWTLPLKSDQWSVGSGEPAQVEWTLEYQDPSGRTQSVTSGGVIYPSSRWVGLRVPANAKAGERIELQAVVVDPAGKPVSQARVQLTAYERLTYSHRKKVVGGFYAYEDRVKLKKIASVCEVVTHSDGLAKCAWDPQALTGNLVFEAKTADERSRPSFAVGQLYIPSRDAWWGGADQDRMDLFPEKRELKTGEKARIRVAMPFREAHAWVTVEREGVLRSFVQKISSEDPWVEVPVEPGDAPNIFVSVLAVRGRVSELAPTGQVDLGKPAFKLGFAELKVGWDAQRLRVSVQTDTATVAVRGKVKAKVQVQGMNLEPVADAELAVAVVDEALLELRPNASWDVLSALMGHRGLGVRTATGQSRVVGKRHLGQKARVPGGDGGRAPTRELFDTLLLWKGRVKLDAQGKAEFEIPVQDSLSRFKVVAIAHAGSSHFGMGEASFVVTQPIMVVPGTPALVRTGDRFKARVTVRNTTQQEQSLLVQARVGDLELEPASIKLLPDESQWVSWPVVAPDSEAQPQMEALFVVRDAEGSKEWDRVRVKWPVVTARPVRTLQATLGQVANASGSLKFSVNLPVESESGRGRVRVTVSPTLVSALHGVKAAATEYPYLCLEQQVSKAVVLGDQEFWKRMSDQWGRYQDEDGLLKFFPDEGPGSEILTAYVLSLSAQSEVTLPVLPRDRMIQGLHAFLKGELRAKRPLSVLRAADDGLRRLFVLEAISYFETVDSATVASLQLSSNLLPPAALASASFLLKKVSGLEALKKAIQSQIDSLWNEQGTQVSLRDADRILWWMLDSADASAARLLLSQMQNPRFLARPGAWVRGLTQRLIRGQWDSTMANAWGSVAIRRFAHQFEKSPVGGKTQLSLLASPVRPERMVEWREGVPVPATEEFFWPKQQGDLMIKHLGPGAPWVMAETRTAIPLLEPLAAGYRIEKTWKALEQQRPGVWTEGDLVKVSVKVQSDSLQTWVAIDDPIPSGSQILGVVETHGDAGLRWSESSFEGLKAYVEWFPSGMLEMEYTLRLGLPGEFRLPSTRVEAMYRSEKRGEWPNGNVVVRERAASE